MSKRLLLVEDDRTLRETLAEALGLEGYDVTTTERGDRAVEIAVSRHFDLVVLDWMLPGMSGVDVLREIRAANLSVPVLLLTVRSAEEDKVTGLEAGADDYVTKPFSLRELLARTKALLRRRSSPLATNAVGGGGIDRFRLGKAIVDLAAFRVECEGEEVPLSPKEAAILRILLAEEGRAVSRSRFLDEIWGEDAAVTNRTIDTHVLHLRQKLEPSGARRCLITVHGIGYRLDRGSDDALEGENRT